MLKRNNKFLYYLKSSLIYIFPKFLLNKHRILKNVESRFDYQKIRDRVDYYNKVDVFFLDSKDSNNSPIKIKDFKIPNKLTNYFFDTYEFMRYFNPNFSFYKEFGDVNYNLKFPCICKSRPIDENNYNNILLNLDKVRHFLFIKDIYKFEEKDNILYFRGGAYQKHRKEFFRMYFEDPRCDIGHTGSIDSELVKYLKQKSNLKTHLKHKFILSLEGNDVATNLKWIMSSNSIAVSTKPKFETWFMEGRLKPDFHYILIDDDYKNVFEKLEFYAKNPSLAKKIIDNANNYCKQFFDKKVEKIISLLVLEKYFKHKKL